MMDSIYVGLTGLTAFSDGLKTISNNVANMNTVGYKSRQSEFADLFYRFQVGSDSGDNATPYSDGSGVTATAAHMNLKQGDFRTTGNDLDVGVDGHGLLVLQGDKGEIYTRAGQFEIDSDGYLVAKNSSNRVLFLSGGGLTPVNVNDFRSNPAKATASVAFSDTLSVNDSTFSVNATVFDSLGANHTLVTKFTNNNTVTAGSWLVEISESGTALKTGEIRFDGTGKVVTGFDSIAFSYKPSALVNNTTLTLDFSKATALSASASSLKVASQNGFTAGSLTKTSFDTDGTIVFSYSNGQTTKGSRLALASFNFESALEPLGNNEFINSSGQERVLGAPSEGEFGDIKGGGIEASNVDLAGQFSELIITQRGYQGSSQVISAANEMIQQLFDMHSKR
ncbi:MAG: flagellar basal-body rod protein FlgF [Pseudomonadota bacterium]